MEDFKRLKEKLKVISNLEEINEHLEWDQEVMMPEGGLKARSEQKSVVSKLSHKFLTEEELGKIIQKLKKKELDEEKAAILREIEREHKRASKVPNNLVEKISEKQSNSVDVWREAREKDDFELFKPELEELVELKRKYANYINSDKEPYRVLFNDFEPYIDFETMDSMMEELKENLIPVIEKIRESDRELTTGAFEGNFEEEKQKKINRKIADEMNYDWDRGRLDVSTHPFTLGNQFDTRITTRYNDENLSESLLPTIHEAGHALYNLGLPKEHYGDPLGKPRDFSIHESQSHLWENHIGRSKQFCSFLLPELKEAFPEHFQDVKTQDCFESLNQVYEENMIRVDADEITYHLHIVVRYELGRKLINGEIEVENLPEHWNDKMEEYLGIRPKNDSEGVLQDIHWGWGSFGYFTTYSIGSVIAAQLYDSMEADLDNLEEKIESGNFKPILEWLRNNIHRHGRFYKTETLVEEATGEPPNTDHFIKYIREKYSELYDVEL